MYSDEYLNSLLKLSEQGAAQMRLEMERVKAGIDTAVLNAPPEFIGKMEKVKALTNKIITLYKEGRVDEAKAATEELKNIQTQ